MTRGRNSERWLRLPRRVRTRAELPSDRREARRVILLLVTADQSVKLLYPHCRVLRDRGWTVHVASSPGPNLESLRASGFETHPIAMRRDVSPARDAVGLVRITLLLWKLKPDVVSAGTPKAGLLGTLAGAVTPKVKSVYLVRGLPLETAVGLKRKILMATERLACRSADSVLTISRSLETRLDDLRICDPKKMRTLGPGSSKGVDIDRFVPDESSRQHAESTRRTLTEPILGYIGRIAPDKGLDILADSLSILAARGVRGTLLVIGNDDSPASAAIRARLDRSDWTVVQRPYEPAVERVYPVLDILCVPSRREGFGNVVLEAALAGVPSVGMSVTGVVDAIVDGSTGLIAHASGAAAYAACIEKLAADEHLRTRLGTAARERVVEQFGEDAVCTRYVQHYESLTPAPSDERQRRGSW
ncbi:glycosyltransferase [Georgenia satyanarayanai]|uniref:glycosyltransferase n=1 Tax=Georgenia satyanarayanai TaxID=860221 RepID=UPI0012646AA7|nr:glycosyltransferase [Georgenia satyanarayanai]